MDDYIYIVYDLTEKELPVAVFGNVKDMSIWFNSTVASMKSRICHLKSGYSKYLEKGNHYYTVRKWEFNKTKKRKIK